MAYFDLFPDLLLPSFTDNRNSSYDYVRVKNLFKRAKIRDDFFQNAVVFDKYSIIGDDRPDNVAQALYNSPQLDWIVLIANNIINVREEWPMSQAEFNNYLMNKYGAELLQQIHHYETEEVRDSEGNLLLQSGLIVDANFQFKYSNFGTYKVLSGANIVNPVTNYDYEITKNDEKRTIYVLREEYLQTVIDDMREIMTYTDSSQYIDNRTKKGANLRILSPR
jgi:Base plate wedge protein 53